MQNPRPSQVFGDFLEFIDGLALAARKGADNILQTMIEMVLDKSLLGLSDSLLDSLQLLGDIKAAATVFDHLDYGTKMAIGAFQPLDDIGMGSVDVCLLAHAVTLSPWRGYNNPIAMAFAIKV